MKRTATTIVFAVAMLLTVANGFAQQSGQPLVAGTTPDRRPEGAPVVRETGLTMYGLATAFHGISDPIPKNLDFIDDQGAWYTPFTRPGMTGVYDIRNFHKSGS